MTALVVSPFLLFALLVLLLYFPPVQRWAAGKALHYASEVTDMDISIRRISLKFPFDLLLCDVNVMDVTGDTVLVAEELSVDVGVRHLLAGRLSVEGLELRNSRFDSRDLIPTVSVGAEVDRLYLAADEIDWKQEVANFSSLCLEDAFVRVEARDTVMPEDTVETVVGWRLLLDKISMKHIDFTWLVPHDTLTLQCGWDRLEIEGGSVNLLLSYYRLDDLSLADGTLLYRRGNETEEVGLDPSFVRLNEWDMKLHDARYYDGSVMTQVNALSFKERSGVVLRSMSGNFSFDEEQVCVEEWKLETDDSFIEGTLTFDRQVLDGEGKLAAGCRAKIGKQDALAFAGRYFPSGFIKTYPVHPLEVSLALDGEISDLTLHTLHVAMEKHFNCRAYGQVNHLLDVNRRKGEFSMNALFQDLSFLSSLSDSPEGKGWRVPEEIRADATMTLQEDIYTTSLTIEEDSGRIAANASYTQADASYRIEVGVDSLDLKHLLPGDSLGVLNARLWAAGEKFDLFDPALVSQVKLQVDTLEYAGKMLTAIALDAMVKEGTMTARLDSHNELLALDAWLDAVLKPEQVKAALNVSLEKADLQRLNLSEVPLQLDGKLTLDANSNLADCMQAKGGITGLRLNTSQGIFHPKDLDFAMRVAKDTTLARVGAGDLDLFVGAGGDISYIEQGITDCVELLTRQLAERKIDLAVLKQRLPELKVKLKAGEDNPVSNYLRYQGGVQLQDVDIRLATSRSAGVSGNGHLYGLQRDSLLLDTLSFLLSQDNAGISLRMEAANEAVGNQRGFTAWADGGIDSTGMELMCHYLDEQGVKGIELGVRADLLDDRLQLKVTPEEPIVAFRPFSLNDSNYISLTDSGRVEADIRMVDCRGTGVAVYSTPHEEALQDVTVDISRLPIGEIAAMFPYFPQLEGVLDAGLHYVEMAGETTLSSSVQVDKFAYEGVSLGNVGAELVYLPMGAGRHLLDMQVLKEGKQVLSLDADYRTADEWLDGHLTLEQFPLDVANGFLPRNLMRLRGQVNGELAVQGITSRPRLDGTLQLDSASLLSRQYSLLLKMDNKPLKLAGNRLLFDKYGVYAQGKNPFIVDGSIDFADFDAMTADLRMQATGYELLDGKKRKGSQLYGKVVVDIASTLKGPLNHCLLQGRMKVSGATDVTYVLMDSPLTVEDRLAGMVTFTDFSDTTRVAEEESPPELEGVEVQMTIEIDRGAQVRVDLNSNGDNYIELEGGGTLSMNYSPQGDISLIGRYTLNSGEMKYSLPIIPLKTFTINNGSYVEFSGDPMNPVLNVVATERVRTSVAEENASRYVNFDVGVAITNTLHNMGLQFLLEAPEDMSLQNQLTSMSEEERGKLAVAMLVTGMYMGSQGNGNKGFNTNNALNSFLQSEISNIAGNALGSVDVSFGMEDSSPGDASSGTDYSFRFAKRFWNNRLSVIIGGTISTGNEAAQRQNESFINDVSLEWRLDDSGTRYVRLFHNKNYESILEGEITETGVGLVLRRKVNNLGELFIFRPRKPRQVVEELPAQAAEPLKHTLKESEVTQ